MSRPSIRSACCPIACYLQGPYTLLTNDSTDFHYRFENSLMSLLSVSKAIDNPLLSFTTCYKIVLWEKEDSLN